MRIQFFWRVSGGRQAERQGSALQKVQHTCIANTYLQEALVGEQNTMGGDANVCTHLRANNHKVRFRMLLSTPHLPLPRCFHTIETLAAYRVPAVLCHAIFDTLRIWAIGQLRRNERATAIYIALSATGCYPGLLAASSCLAQQAAPHGGVADEAVKRQVAVVRGVRADVVGALCLHGWGCVHCVRLEGELRGK